VEKAATSEAGGSDQPAAAHAAKCAKASSYFAGSYSQRRGRHARGVVHVVAEMLEAMVLRGKRS